MRFSKGIFSRLFIVGFSILAQIFLFAVILSRINEYHIVFNTIMNIIGYVVVISIINRDMITEAKIPWIIITLIIPVFGTVMYLCFSEYKLSKDQKKEQIAIISKLEKCFEGDNFYHSEVTDKFPKYKGQCNYIKNTTLNPAFDGNKTEYFKCGEDFWQSLLYELGRAEKFIFMEYFIIEQGVMWDKIFEILKEKASMGVEVRLMYDDLGSVNTLNWDFDRQMKKEGIICLKFNPFKPIISERHNNRDHRKITVIDGKVGFIGGANIADEYINVKSRFGYWKDTAVSVKGKGVKSLTAMFLHTYDTQVGIVENYEKYLCLPQYEYYEESGLVQFYCDGPKPAFNDYVSENVFLNIINQSQRYIWITTPYLIIDSKLENALSTAVKRGVSVKIITPHIPDKKAIFAMTRSYYKRLQKSGVEIFEFLPGFMHAKQIICDDEIAIVGTVNLDYRSLVHHYECGVLMVNTPAISDIKEDFKNIFIKSKNMAGFTQKKIITLLCRILTAFTPLL